MGFNLSDIDNNKIKSTLSYDRVDVQSFFVNNLNESIELDNMYNSIKEDFYTNISNESIPLDESLSEYISSVKSIIINSRNKIIDVSDQYVKKSKQYRIPDGFNINAARANINKININITRDYRFREDIPTLSIIGDKFFSDEAKLEKIIIDNNISDTAKLSKIMELRDNIYKIGDVVYNKGSIEYWDKIRAKIIHSKDPIGADKYVEVLYNTYRIKTNRNVNDKDLINAYNNLKNDSSIRAVMDEKSNILSKYTKLIDEYNNIKLSRFLKYSNTNSSLNEIESLLVSYVIYKSDQLNKISSLHRMAFSAKLDALSEQRETQYNLLNALDLLDKGGE